MVEIKAFRGWMYNKDKVKDFSKVITPPNDVISAKEKEELKKERYNFVKLILPDGNGDKYENAAKLYSEWKKEGILVQDKKDNIYIYSESYNVGEKKFSRTGFISLLKMEPLGCGVLPHEKVLEKDLKDRTELIRVTKSNLEIPFLLYDDREKLTDAILADAIKNRMPDIDFKDKAGVQHRLWRISNEDVIERLVKEMKKYQCIIADGHHRYTSELRVGNPYGLMCFVNSFNEGMVLLPTNRIVFGLDIDPAYALNRLRQYFEIEYMDVKEMIEKLENVEVMIDKKTNLKNHVMGVVYGNKAILLTLKDNDVLREKLPNNTNIYQRLDINILHKLIIEEILGISEEQQKNREHIDFIKGNNETLERLGDKNIQSAFFINPPLMREVFLTARAGETMPQKSTYFYPKVFSGLVVYDFNEN